jgi:hypothetical protein
MRPSSLPFSLGSTVLPPHLGRRRPEAETPQDRQPAMELTAVVVLLLAASGVHAQTLFDHEVQCPSCVIRIEPHVVLGDDDHAVVGENFAIARDARGRFLVSYPESGSELLVFDSRGEYLRTVGRRGQGPGEYIWIDKIVVVGDRIHLFDALGRRWTVLDHDFQVVDTRRLERQAINVIVLDDGRAVVNSSIPTPERAGIPVHVLAPTGEVIRSVGDEGRPFMFSFRTSDMRRLARARDPEEFWIVPHTSYVLERWTTDGRRVQALEPRVPPFPGYEGNCCTLDPETPPEPRVEGVQVDSAGLLWVLYSVAAAEWHRGLVLDDPDRGTYWVKDWNLVFDSVIDVIDPAAGTLLASVRHDEFFWGWVGEGLLPSFRWSGPHSLQPRIHVWKVELLSSTSFEAEP